MVVKWLQIFTQMIQMFEALPGRRMNDPIHQCSQWSTSWARCWSEGRSGVGVEVVCGFLAGKCGIGLVLCCV